jgi:hypothetical protein
MSTRQSRVESAGFTNVEELMNSQTEVVQEPSGKSAAEYLAQKGIEFAFGSRVAPPLPKPSVVLSKSFTALRLSSAQYRWSLLSQSARTAEVKPPVAVPSTPSGVRLH